MTRWRAQSPAGADRQAATRRRLRPCARRAQPPPAQPAPPAARRECSAVESGSHAAQRPLHDRVASETDDHVVKTGQTLKHRRMLKCSCHAKTQSAARSALCRARRRRGERARCRRDKPGDDVEQRRLAGTVRSHQSVQGAGRNLERNAVHRAQGAVGFEYTLDSRSRRLARFARTKAASNGLGRA